MLNKARTAWPGKRQISVSTALTHWSCAVSLPPENPPHRQWLLKLIFGVDHECSIEIRQRQRLQNCRPGPGRLGPQRVEHRPDRNARPDGDSRRIRQIAAFE